LAENPQPQFPRAVPTPGTAAPAQAPAAAASRPTAAPPAARPAAPQRPAAPPPQAPGGRAPESRDPPPRRPPPASAPPPPPPPTDDKPVRATGITAPSRRGSSGRFLTDVIVDLGFAPRSMVDGAVESARTAGKPPERLLLEQGVISDDQLALAIAERYGLDHIALGEFKVDMATANLISPAAARRYDAVPVARIDERTLLVAMADPSNVLAIDDVAMMTGLEVRPAVASREDVVGLVSRLNRLDDAVQEAVDEDEAEGAEIVDLHETAGEAPVIKLVHSIIAQAVEIGASDIHFEPDGKEMRVRFRVDGVLSESASVPRRMVSGVVSRVKIMAELDISERRVPQDGRVGLTIEGRHVDVRVVTLPSVHGESVVLRILDQGAALVGLDKLGMLADAKDRFETAFSKPYGAVLTTGPTGSGKSTSLYAALGQLNTPEKNIITIEDPVEYQIGGITQVQVNPRAGLTFATGLRSMMRADPDIIMVGEIRDRETAQIAIEAALTGHLVLSTLHTNDAPTTVTRLTEMGIEPFLVASAIDTVVAQRLARTLCASCKKRTIVPVDTLRASGFHIAVDLEAYEPVGCGRCGGSGYKGRIGMYEVMPLTEEIRALILERRSADEIAEIACRQGMRRLRDDGLEKVRLGLTSIAEVTRVA
jgi:type IV pilus assembly protein PilB